MIIVPVVGPTMSKALSQIRESERYADIFELRLDLINEPDPARLVRASKRPLVATCRPSWEGGKFTGSESVRAQLLLEAAVSGVQYIDIEIEADPAIRLLFNDLRPSLQVIISHHKRAGSRFRVASEYARFAEVRADVVKFAYHADDASDCRFAFEFLRLARRDRRKAIAIAMGPFGEPSRVLYRIFGGWATFASAGAGAESAPGQIPAAELREVFGAHLLNTRTRVFGLLGDPVAHSKGPLIHNAQFRKAGLNAVYCRFRTQNLRAFMRHIAPDLEGLSVTIPFKETVIRYLARTDRSAREIGASNTVFRRNGKLVGTNTDAPAALESIERAISARGKRFLIVGAGGAARAVAYEARRRGADVRVTNRTDARSRILARRMKVSWLPWKEFKNGRRGIADVIVNATSVGMVPDVGRSVVPKRLVCGIVAVDAVYNPPVTRFLIDARRSGSRVVSGMDWFLNQAVRQAKVFGVRRPDPLLMLRTLRRHTPAT